MDAFSALPSSDLAPASFALLVLVVVALKLADADAKKAKREAFRQRVQQVAEHGPDTLQEQLWLFPGACCECGCRDLWQHELHWGAAYPEFDGYDYYSCCVRCGHGDAAALQGAVVRVYSPYLSKDESDGVPDFRGAAPSPHASAV